MHVATAETDGIELEISNFFISRRNSQRSTNNQVSISPTFFEMLFCTKVIHTDFSYFKFGFTLVLGKCCSFNDGEIDHIFVRDNPVNLDIKDKFSLTYFFLNRKHLTTKYTLK